MRPEIWKATSAAVRRPVSAEAGHVLPALDNALPVSPSTLLGLELLAQRPAFDLRSAAWLVHDDPGAVLAVFRALAKESGEAPTHILRLEECLAGLPCESLLQALAGAGCRRRAQQPFAVFRRHALLVGRAAETVAATLGLPAELAYLVGMLHDLGRAPMLLGWSHWPDDPAACCDRLARSCGLPAPLRRALAGVHQQQPESVWVAVVRAAHDLLPREPAHP